MEWQTNTNVNFAPEPPGGWGAHGAPCDAAHAHFRRITDALEDVALGFSDDPLQRQRLELILQDSIGYAPKNLSVDSLVEIVLWAWERMPRPLLRWSWTSRGLITRDQMKVWHNLNDADRDAQEGHRLERDFLSISDFPVVPRPAATTAGIKKTIAEKTTGESSRTWYISEKPCNAESITEDEKVGGGVGE